MRAPQQITWSGLKRVRPRRKPGWHDIREIRIGKKAIRLVGVDDDDREDPVLRFEKYTAGPQSWDIKVTFIDDRPPPGVLRRYLGLYLTQEEAETLGQWLLDGRYVSPHSKRRKA